MAEATNVVRWAKEGSGMRRLISILVVGFMLLSVAGTALASAKPIIIRDDVAGDVFVNDCTGEVVTLTGGTFQIVFHETFDTSGCVHFIAEGNAKGVVGEGSFGNSYRATGGFWDEFNSNAGSQETFTGVFNIHLLSSGSDDNFILQGTFHVTVNANGDLTAFVDQFTVVCAG